MTATSMMLMMLSMFGVNLFIGILPRSTSLANPWPRHLFVSIDLIASSLIIVFKNQNIFMLSLRLRVFCDDCTSIRYYSYTAILACSLYRYFRENSPVSLTRHCDNTSVECSV